MASSRAVTLVSWASANRYQPSYASVEMYPWIWRRGGAIGLHDTTPYCGTSDVVSLYSFEDCEGTNRHSQADSGAPPRAPSVAACRPCRRSSCSRT